MAVVLQHVVFNLSQGSKPKNASRVPLGSPTAGQQALLAKRGRTVPACLSRFNSAAESRKKVHIQREMDHLPMDSPALPVLQGQRSEPVS